MKEGNYPGGVAEPHRPRAHWAPAAEVDRKTTTVRPGPGPAPDLDHRYLVGPPGWRAKHPSSEGCSVMAQPREGAEARPATESTLPGGPLCSGRGPSLLSSTKKHSTEGATEAESTRHKFTHATRAAEWFLARSPRWHPTPRETSYSCWTLFGGHSGVALPLCSFVCRSAFGSFLL